jgi:hypothetical protein
MRRKLLPVLARPAIANDAIAVNNVEGAMPADVHGLLSRTTVLGLTPHERRAASRRNSNANRGCDNPVLLGGLCRRQTAQSVQPSTTAHIRMLRR